MLRKIIYIGLILCGLLFTMCNLATIPIKTQTGQLDNGHKPANEVLITNEPANIVTYVIPEAITFIREQEALYNQQYPINHENGARQYSFSINKYITFVNFVVNGFFSEIQIKELQKMSKDGLMSRDAFFDITRYAVLIEASREGLRNFQKNQLFHRKFTFNINLQLATIYELFEDQNVELYKKIKGHLATGQKPQDIMMFVDTSLSIMFEMFNLCVRKNQYDSKDHLYPTKFAQIDLSSGNIEHVLEQGRYKSKPEKEL